ncbi:hypothetical protein [Bradyrhizobium canariense]|uniref:Uncharacterized protein n=1 Tax=Bradyrhizobium canariense TaxID=255045 RepID=A0A1H1USX0_9BRAD|nr:hypothetical protein [Bradyrhizobium canariense]SDS75684.1 hypothetical protein SAMN05444158_3092 [Bradyrhizobium canariense]
MNSNEILFFMAAVSSVFLATSNDCAQAMPLTRPGTLVVEKITIEVQWRHRHHQLRRHSRQQLNDNHRPKHRGDQADTYSTTR